ncbi:four helix bundle protein [Vibrio sp. 1863]|uniref:four helix bundle protein n=1 Tax=Vibrio sp. 1863 TaxID=3074579 RepID=UPI0029640B10|nr:four helix bundle protein [Vibrio sp. 1863]MDW2075401.1 four helix bundle protein [Vibrio sp. 1863]
MMRQLAFEKLEVWKRGCRLSCQLYQGLDSCKNYGFKDQLTRSALSIASNIAEGKERDTANESADSYTLQNAPLAKRSLNFISV